MNFPADRMEDRRGKRDRAPGPVCLGGQVQSLASRTDRPPLEDLPPLEPARARGRSHAGWRHRSAAAIETLGLQVDAIVGTSIGSLIGAMYAGSRSVGYIEEELPGLAKDDYFRLNAKFLAGHPGSQHVQRRDLPAGPRNCSRWRPSTSSAALLLRRGVPGHRCVGADARVPTSGSRMPCTDPALRRVRALRVEGRDGRGHHRRAALRFANAAARAHHRGRSDRQAEPPGAATGRTRSPPCSRPSTSWRT